MGNSTKEPYGRRSRADKGNLPYNPNERMGRVFSESELQLIEDYSKLGMAVKDISEALFISFSSFQEIMRRNKSMVEEYDNEGGLSRLKDDIFYINPWYRWQRGKHLHKLTISKSVLEKAEEGNIPILLHLAKTRLGWTETAPVYAPEADQVLGLEAGGEVTGNIEDITDNELDKAVAEALKVIDVEANEA